MADFHGDLTVRMSGLGDDIVVQGAAVMVLSGRLGSRRSDPTATAPDATSVPTP